MSTLVTIAYDDVATAEEVRGGLVAATKAQLMTVCARPWARSRFPSSCLLLRLAVRDRAACREPAGEPEGEQREERDRPDRPLEPVQLRGGVPVGHRVGLRGGQARVGRRGADVG